MDGKGGSGTGFLVAPGILATNSHVIDGEYIANLEIRFPSADEGKKGPVQAELLYEDVKRDLAFLAVKTDLPALQVAPSYRYRKGEDVTVIGNPGVDGETVLENAISRGVMSSKAQIDGQQFYQLGIAVNPGNSGGPVFDSHGQVIGVVTLRIPGKEELSFCIPVEELQAGMTKLKSQSSGLANEVRSHHRMMTTYKCLGAAGAVFGIALELRVASRSDPGNQDLKEKVGKLDEALAKLDQSLLFKLSEETRDARNDPLFPRPARTKVGALADNYKKLRQTYDQPQSNAPVATIRALKATHRRLVVEIGSDLKQEVPKGLLEALDDHLVTGSSMAMTIPFPSSGSARSRIWERHGITPPSSRLGRTGIGSRSGIRTPSRISPRSRFGR
ncbi:serine protease [Singulisphaera sp. GP187]|uniref:S1 family peptidase n=1 Tax=Singulisphaera sp. GP187 TaxID=1882752 RepID=UPI002110B4C6|nr:serine protease [Singulisphaera sp. GP187]